MTEFRERKLENMTKEKVEKLIKFYLDNGFLFAEIDHTRIDGKKTIIVDSDELIIPRVILKF